LDMGRYRGIGMPRAKKKKVEEVQEVQEDQGDEPPSPDPPPPPSPPRKPSRAVAPESPSKSVLLRAQQKSCATIRKKFKEAKAIQVAAYRDLDVAKRRFSRQVDDIHRDENRKLPLKKPSPMWHLQKAHSAPRRRNSSMSAKHTSVKLRIANRTATDAARCACTRARSAVRPSYMWCSVA